MPIAAGTSTANPASAAARGPPPALRPPPVLARAPRGPVCPAPEGHDAAGEQQGQTDHGTTRHP